SLDDNPLEESKMLLAASLNGGRIRWCSKQENLNASVIERRDGKTHQTHSVPLQRAGSRWELSSEPNELILIASEDKHAEGLKIFWE
ncbi:MAG: hypothetical protein ACP5I1_16115, partial [Candidatus Hinthialibacter sp.]